MFGLYVLLRLAVAIFRINNTSRWYRQYVVGGGVYVTLFLISGIMFAVSAYRLAASRLIFYSQALERATFQKKMEIAIEAEKLGQWSRAVDIYREFDSHRFGSRVRSLKGRIDASGMYKSLARAIERRYGFNRMSAMYFLQALNLDSFDDAVRGKIGMCVNSIEQLNGQAAELLLACRNTDEGRAIKIMIEFGHMLFERELAGMAVSRRATLVQGNSMSSRLLVCEFLSGSDVDQFVFRVRSSWHFDAMKETLRSSTR